MIGLFLATLELVRQRRLLVVQNDLDGEIMLQLNADPDNTATEDERLTDDAHADPDQAASTAGQSGAEIEFKPQARPSE